MLEKSLAPWAHCGMVIGFLSGVFVGIRLLITHGETAYLNAATAGALSGYLVGLGLGLLALEIKGLFIQDREKGHCG